MVNIEMKQPVNANKPSISLLDELPESISALTRANRIQQCVAQHGFDWPSWHGPFDKVVEELEEVKAELNSQPVAHEKVQEELADLLFSVVNLVRSQSLEPEEVLNFANDKFERRFRAVENVLLGSGLTTKVATLEQMEAAWQQVKVLEKG